MQKSLVKRKLAAGQPVYVPKVCYMDPNIVELVGLLGFDSIWICNEYKGIDPVTLENMIRSGRATATECIIRTGANSFDEINRYLGAGANGLMTPHVQTPEIARQVVRCAKFPPVGKREVEFINADAKHGLMNMHDYLREANQETVVVVQLEDMDAIDRVDEFAEIVGVDVLFVGPGDLSVALGIPGEVQHPKIIEAIRRVARACHRNGIVCGTPSLNTDHCKRMLDEGVLYLTGGSDWRMIVRGFREEKERFETLGFSFRTEGGEEDLREIHIDPPEAPNGRRLGSLHLNRNMTVHDRN